MPSLIPVQIGNTASPLLATLFTVIYWGIIAIIILDVILYHYKKFKHTPKPLTYNDYQRVIDDEYVHMLMPILADATLEQFNRTMASYYKTFEKVLNKNTEYLEAIKPLDPSSPEYIHLAECEYYILTMISELAKEVCTKFEKDLIDTPLGFAECQHSVVQKYCALVNLFSEQKTRIENEQFIPTELKGKYLQISDSLFSLFNFINSIIKVG